MNERYSPPQQRSHSEEIIGQYATDKILFADDPRLDEDPGMVKALRGDGLPQFHQAETLYDEASGINLINGKERRDPTEVDQLLSEGELVVTDNLDQADESISDAAEEWLRRADPEYNKKTWH